MLVHHPIDQIDAELRVILKASLVVLHGYDAQKRRNLSEWCEVGLADVVRDAVVVEGEVALIRMVPEAACVTACVLPARNHSKKGATNGTIIPYRRRGLQNAI